MREHPFEKECNSRLAHLAKVLEVKELRAEDKEFLFDRCCEIIDDETADKKTLAIAISSFVALEFNATGKNIMIFDKDTAEEVGKTTFDIDSSEVIRLSPYKAYWLDAPYGKKMKGVFVVTDDEYIDKILIFHVFIDGYSDVDADDPSVGVTLNEKDDYYNNLVAYISSVNADINKVYTPRKDLKPNPKKRRSKAHVYEVGFRLGSELREYQKYVAEHSKPKGGKKRPHIRRAHWHRFWTGPRNGERKINIKWIPPVFVGIKDEEFSAIGHKVR